MAQNDLKWTKNDPKWPKNDILMSGGTFLGLKSKKKCIPLSSTFDVEAPFQRYVLKKLNFGPKMTFCYPGGTYLGPKSKKNAARYFNF